jgi:hypothetical protein
VDYGRRVASTKKLFAKLTRRGPHRVLRGDLAFAGVPGVVYTPDTGFNLPAVVFGHDWLTTVGRYQGTLEHLASWGIVAAAPDTELGLAPSALNFAYDLGTTLDIVAGVRLGPGQISVHPTKLAVAGHGFGGSAAVLSAVRRSGDGSTFVPKTVAALFPAVTSPRAENAATSLKLPGLVLTAPDGPRSIHTIAEELNDAWAGAVLRIVSKAKPGELPDGRRWARFLGLPGADKGTQRAVRALLTGFLLYELAGEKAYSEFADPQATLPSTEGPDPDAEPVTLEDKVVALLKP